MQQASGRAAEPCAGKPGRPSRRAVVHCETCVFPPAPVLVSSARSRNELARPEQGGSLHAASLGYAAPARARFSPSGILEDLLPQLQHTLAALADVECRYEAVREELEASPKPKAAKNRLLAELDEQRQHEKEPLHRKLAELHFRILNVAATQEICLAG